MSRRSAAVSFAGLPRILSGMPIFPTSWSRQAVFGARLLQQLGTQHTTQLDRVLLHALRVCTRDHVLGLERVREGNDGVVIRVLKQAALAALDLEQVTQVARVEHELLFLTTRVLRAKRNAMEPTDETFDNGEQLERAERFRQDGVRARLTRDDLVDRPCEQHDGNRPRARVALEPAAEVDAALARHVHVEDDRVGDPGVEERRRARGILGLVDLHLERVEGCPEAVPSVRRRHPQQAGA